jgi:hypothetical protein
MTLRRLAILQWVGLGLGATAWVVQLVTGYGVTEAECHAGGARWGLSNDAWQLALMGVAVACILTAEAAAVTVVRRTNPLSYQDAPPPGRIRFFAIAAVLANVLFLTIVLLSGIGAIVNVTCRGA